MVNFISIALAAGTFFGLTMAIPATHIRPTGVVHQIVAGINNTLRFVPDNVIAAKGDMIEVIFFPKNHTITQSSFDKPCEPLKGGVSSGFNFATMNQTAPNVFTFVVENTEPFWFYCSQPVGDHCKKGMSGVINEKAHSGKTLAKYKEIASSRNVTNQPSKNPTKSKGGWIVPRFPL